MGLQVKDLGAQEASENILAPLSLVPIKDTGLCSHGHLASPHHPLSCQFGGAWPGAIFVPYLRRRRTGHSHLPLHLPSSPSCC